MEGLTPGRVVHFIARGEHGGEEEAGVHLAAIVTLVHPPRHDYFPVGLCIFTPYGLFFGQNVDYDASATTPGTWHWPERA